MDTSLLKAVNDEIVELKNVILQLKAEKKELVQTLEDCTAGLYNADFPENLTEHLGNLYMRSKEVIQLLSIAMHHLDINNFIEAMAEDENFTYKLRLDKNPKSNNIETELSIEESNEWEMLRQKPAE